jgi:hypothetical protein
MTDATTPLADLRQAFRDGWPPTLRFIEWAGGTDVTPEQTETSSLSQAINLKSSEAKELFAGIQGLKLAKFIVGRRGQPSRLIWHFTLASIAAVARGEADAFEPINQNSLPKREQAIELIKYSFQLRRDLMIEFALPTDLSPQDVARLAAFLQTLPLDD